LTPGIDINASQGFNIADDFRCTTTGPITDIRIWGSWLSDNIDPTATYTLTIYSDDPVGPNNPEPFSHPDQPLWQQTFTNGQYGMCLYTNITEQFFTPNTAAPFLTPLGGSTNLYYLCFKIDDPAAAFRQTGNPQVPTNYWLSVYVQSSIVGNPFNFGWKTSATNYNDRAVWGLGNLPPPTGWTPMTDPRTQGPVNMAFKINTTSNTTSCVITNVIKYVQNPDESSLGVDVWNSSAFPPGVTDGPWLLADDFVCTNTGAITDIHLWGSWLNDHVDNSKVTFWLGVFDDVAASNSFPSHPGSLIWNQCFAPGQYAVQPFISGQETFMDPGPPANIGTDSQIWYYCFYPTNPPIQHGNFTAPKVYWLAAYAILPSGETNYFGWKTTTSVQHDISVHASFNPAGCPNLPIGAQLPIWTPNITPTGRPLDLAFMLTTSTNCMVSINCPSDKTNQCTTGWSFDPPTVIDTCCPTPGLNLVSNLVSSSPCSQVYQGIWTVYDCTGATVLGVCTQYVTVLDTNAPIFNGCVASKPVQCGTVWTFDKPTANYLCSGSNALVGIISTLTNAPNDCSNIVTRVWGTTNQCNGAFALCTEVVTITDTNPPSITCPSNITVYTCDTNAIVTWPTNVATATCGTATVTSTPPSGTAFLPNTTNTVVFTARNACGVTNSCSFTVAVVRPVLGTITITPIATNKVVLTWTYGILQSRTNLANPFFDVIGATSPYTNSTVPPPSDLFFRLRCNSP
jgi:hypothetical protein